MYRKLLETVSIFPKGEQQRESSKDNKRDILQVFSVRQVQKRSCVQISSLETTLHLGLDAIALLIFPAEQ